MRGILRSRTKFLLITILVVIVVGASGALLAIVDNKASENTKKEALSAATEFVNFLEEGNQDSITRAILAKHNLTINSNLNGISDNKRDDIVRLSSVAGYLSGVLAKNNAQLDTNTFTETDENTSLQVSYSIPLNENTGTGYFDLTIKRVNGIWLVEDLVLRDK